MTASAGTVDCLEQCRHIQSLNDSPHHSSIFCYSAAEHGWTPDNPVWEVRMEIRCQEGHWAEKMKGFRRRRHFHNFGASGGGGGGNKGGKDKGGNKKGHNHGDPGIQAYGSDGNKWTYEPRWFYCNAMNWLDNNDAAFGKLEHGHQIAKHSACAHAHEPPNFQNGCNVETYDFGSGQYHCDYHGYGEYDHGHGYGHDHGHGHGHGQGHSHGGHHHHGKRDTEAAEEGATRSLEEAEERWGGTGYEKVCQVQCAWPSIPRRMLSDGTADKIICDTATNKWKNNEGPMGCDEPYGRGHQCHQPYGEKNGHWHCEGPHADNSLNYDGDHDHKNKNKGHSHSSPYFGHHIHRRDANETEAGDRHLGTIFGEDHIGHLVGHHHDHGHGHHHGHGYHGHHHGDYHGHHHGHHHHHYASNGFYTALHAITKCKLTCNPGFVSSTCTYEFSCDPTTFPSWGPGNEPAMCVPETIKQCPRDCKNPPAETKNGGYKCVRLPGAWKTECTLHCNKGFNHRGLTYKTKDTSLAVLECNSDDIWYAPAKQGATTCTEPGECYRDANDCKCMCSVSYNKNIFIA